MSDQRPTHDPAAGDDTAHLDPVSPGSSERSPTEPTDDASADGAADGRRTSDGGSDDGDGGSGASTAATGSAPRKRGFLGGVGHFLREVAIVIVVALIASALLRAFVVQAFFVPSGSMLPEIQLHDRILVSRIGGIDRGEVVVFQDPGNWIPAAEEPEPPSGVRKAFEWIGVLPASGHEHLVKRAIGLPGDHVVCCDKGKLVINDVPVDESDFLRQGDKRADNYSFDVIVPAEHIFVLGDNRYVSGDSSRQIDCLDPMAGFVPMDLVTGRAFAVIWPRENMHMLRVPDAYDDVPDGQDPPEEGVVTVAEMNAEACAGKAP